MAANVKAAAKNKGTAAKKKSTARKKPAVAAKKKSAARKKTAAAGAQSTRAKKAAAAKKTTAVKKKPAARVTTVATPSEQPLMKALRAEHRHMSTVMQLFSDQLKAIEAGELVDTHVVYEIMDYMVTWPDRFHHPREDLIYARVAEIDEKSVDDVDTLQRDHDQTASRGGNVL